MDVWCCRYSLNLRPAERMPGVTWQVAMPVL
jgi:hypothetical protein